MKTMDCGAGLHLHVVSHTHWDREWYQPFEVFRLRLTDLIDHLLDIFRKYPDYVFELDAQTICLEDYLEIRPGRREELEERIRAGNLRVGPWYVQNDFFLTSGEATIRNLLTGMRIAASFGRCGDVGYAPDQFGLIRQLPQILAGFGIDSCVFGRGFDRRTRNEFYWESPDGSRVLASFLSRWYNNFQRISADPERAAHYAAAAVSRQNDEAATSHRLLMNGVDHLEAQEDLPERLALLPGFRQSTLRAFLDGVKAEAGDKLPVLAQEMRNDSFEMLLSGTLSARSPLKARNVRAQAALELGVEALGVILAESAGDWSLYEAEPLRCAWKLLLRNHPHDSICGCSNSRVHADNENRFARLEDLTGALRDRLFRRFFERIDRTAMDPEDYLLAVFNPAPERVSEEVEAKLFLPLADKVSNFEIRDPAGEVIPFEVCAVRLRSFGNYPPINLPGKCDCRELDIRFPAVNLPAAGYRVYTVHPCAGRLPAAGKACRMGNEYLSFEVEADGKLRVTDRETGRVYENLVAFRDEADIGHTYNFFPAPGDREIDLGAVSRVSVHRRSACVEVGYRFELPADYDFARHRRTGRTRRNSLTVRYSLKRFSRHLNVDFELDNHSSAHRLKVLFRVPGTDASAHASVPFGFEKRPKGNFFRGFPSCGVASVENLAVYHCGLYEFEYRTDGWLSLTLLRCVGRITNSAYPDAPSVAEPYEWEVPDANLIGTHRFSAALRFGRASLPELEREYRRFLQPAMVAFDAADERKFTSGRPCEQAADLAETFFRTLPEETKRLTREYSLFALSGGAVLSCCKRAEESDQAIIRVFNPDFEHCAAFAVEGAQSISPADLAERPCAPSGTPGVLRKGEIATFYLNPSR